MPPSSEPVATAVSTNKSAAKGSAGNTWGRAQKGDWSSCIQAVGIMGICPVLLLVIHHCIMHDGGAITKTAGSILTGPIQFFTGEFLTNLPRPTFKAFSIYFGWIVSQALLSVYFPGPTAFGQQTPAGHLLEYRVNGLRVWFFSYAILLTGAYFGVYKLSILYDNWGSLLVWFNLFGFALTLFVYIKALLFSTHPDDNKHSQSYLYDFFMGIELNPRIGKWFDFKLFFNGRTGIMGWAFINLSMAAKQYENIGYVTNSMICVNLLHLLYILDFYNWESWYLRTIDIAHDHFGFYLAWGDLCWLPFYYTLQSFFLVQNPVNLNPIELGIVIALGAGGYLIFRDVNNQKDQFRSSADKSKFLVWGKPAQYIECQYNTSNGEKHTSFLLMSGWWGFSRHANYVGDLMMSFAFCFSCGITHMLPYAYFIYMAILLLHRIERDHDRLTAKYKEDWKKYCKTVPYKLLPYVY